MSLMHKRTDLTKICFPPFRPSEDFLEKVSGTLQTLRFKGFYRQTDKDASGFAPLFKQEDPGVYFESMSDWLDGDVIFVAYRTDTKRLPTGLLKARVKIAVAKWCEERGVEKCPAAVKKEIKLTLEDDLISRALPTTKVSEILIFPSTGVAWIDSTSDKRVDEVRKALRKLGFEGRVWTPGELRRAETDDAAQTSDLPQGVVTSFYAWIWHNAETGNGSYGPPNHVVKAWVDSRIAFRRPVEEKATTVVTGDNPADAVTARAAIANRMVVQDVRIGLQHDDRDYFVTLCGPQMQLKAIQGPLILSEESEHEGHANMFDRIFLLNELNDMVVSMLDAFLDVYHDVDGGLAKLDNSIATWASEQDGIIAEFGDE
jgi:hypothetical protein